MLLRQNFDPYLAQYAYLIGCQRTGEALVIDPERDIEQYQKIASENGFRITAVAETHIHADFVSGAQEFSRYPEIHIYLSDEGGEEWRYRWPKDRPNTHRLKEGDSFKVGSITFDVLHTPGHTPEHISFLITDSGAGADSPIALVSGDFLFVGDVGRPDLLESAAGMKDVMEPSARVLCASLVSKLSSLEDHLQILPAHGAGSACGKSLGAVPTTTLGYERRFNSSLRLALTDQAAFVKDVLKGQPEPPLYFATMKRVNRDGVSVTGGIPEISKLAPMDFINRSHDSRVRIIDAREDREAFDRAHVPLAINAPLRTPLFSAAAGSFIGPDEKILLVIEEEKDVDLAVRQLYRIGLDGTLGWISVGEATEAGLMTATTNRVLFPDLNDKTTNGTIIDVRTSSEYLQGHIEGAEHHPYTRLKDQVNELPRDRKLYVHCATGRRAGIASSFLAAEGFDVVHVDGVFRGEYT